MKGHTHTQTYNIFIFCLGAHATQADSDLVGSLMKAVGVCELVPERLMDAISGLSGSGPAYVCIKSLKF